MIAFSLMSERFDGFGGDGMGCQHRDRTGKQRKHEVGMATKELHDVVLLFRDA
jgi:hypothetical protein